MWEKAYESKMPLCSALITGLVEGNEYQFRVIAVNKAGESEPSDASKTFVAKPRFRKFNKSYFLISNCNSIINMFSFLQWHLRLTDVLCGM